MKIKKQHHPHRRNDSTPDLWALLTIIAYPISMFVAGAMGANWFVAFWAGFLGVIAVLFANGIVERRLWMFDPKWRARFEQPEFAFKLAVISGAILLILETALIVIFFTDGSLDKSLLELVFSRQCRATSVAMQQLCSAVSAYIKF